MVKRTRKTNRRKKRDPVFYNDVPFTGPKLLPQYSLINNENLLNPVITEPEKKNDTPHTIEPTPEESGGNNILNTITEVGSTALTLKNLYDFINSGDIQAGANAARSIFNRGRDVIGGCGRTRPPVDPFDYAEAPIGGRPIVAPARPVAPTSAEPVARLFIRRAGPGAFPRVLEGLAADGAAIANAARGVASGTLTAETMAEAAPMLIRGASRFLL
jgi:hypothetical protein